MRAQPFFQWIMSLIKPAWAPSLVFVIHIVACNVLRVYDTHPLFDIPMHFFGGLAMAYFLEKAYVNALLVTASTLPSRLMKNLLIFTSTCTVAVFWEFGEFLLSWILSANFQGDLADTMKDLFFGMTGSVFYIAAASLSIELGPRVFAWAQFNRVTIEPESE